MAQALGPSVRWHLLTEAAHRRRTVCQVVIVSVLGDRGRGGSGGEGVGTSRRGRWGGGGGGLEVASTDVVCLCLRAFTVLELQGEHAPVSEVGHQRVCNRRTKDMDWRKET